MAEQRFETRSDCFWKSSLGPWLLCPTVNPKENQSWIFIGRTDAETETPVLWPSDAMNRLIGKDPEAGQDWRQEEKGMTEDEMVGWHHQIDGHEFEQAQGVGDEEGSLARCSPRGHIESDMTEQLNWTEQLLWQEKKSKTCDTEKVEMLDRPALPTRASWYVTKAIQEGFIEEYWSGTSPLNDTLDLTWWKAEWGHCRTWVGVGEAGWALQDHKGMDWFPFQDIFIYLFAAHSENCCIWSSWVIFTALPEASKDIKWVTQMWRMFLLAGRLWELNLAFCNQGEVHPSEWRLWPTQGLLLERE